MDMTIAQTIFAQLGANRFMMMTGSKNFVGTDAGLRFQVGRNHKGITHIQITLKSDDTYTMDFLKIRGARITTADTKTEIYCDMLREIFTDATGLYTSL